MQGIYTRIFLGLFSFGHKVTCILFSSKVTIILLSSKVTIILLTSKTIT